MIMKLINFYLLNCDNKGKILEWVLTSPNNLFSSFNFCIYFKKILSRLTQDEIHNHACLPLIKIISEKKFNDSITKEDEYLVKILRMIKTIIKLKNVNSIEMKLEFIFDLIFGQYLFPADLCNAYCQNKKTRLKAYSILNLINKLGIKISVNSIEVY